MAQSFHDLEVYKHSKELFKELTLTTKGFPPEGKYLVTQLHRSANSVHGNIAEGYGRSEAEFKNYLRRALGSNNGTLSHLEDAYITGCVSEEVYQFLKEGYTVLGKQLYRLRENWKQFS